MPAPGTGPDDPTLAAHQLARQADAPATLGGYRLGQRLGSGGMASVYRAEQMSLGRQVALKVIGPPHTADAAFCDRFLREARVAAAVNHPNIITVYDVGQDRNFLYMALELVGGGDAAEATTAEGGRLDERRALAVVIDCCHGLIALDHAGLIHRDIKPANIFLTRGPGGERAKLADLGLARHRSDASLTADGALLGTPAYMSPEQASAEGELDIRSDLYSLGASFYALLTGQSPFTGTSAYSVVSKLLNDPAPDPRQVQPAISNASASIVLHCLAKHRDDRYRNAQELLTDLECARAGQPLQYAPMLPHPSASWDRVTSSGPVPKHIRNHSTLDIAARDELGVDDGDPVAGKGLWWIFAGVAVGVLVVVGASLAGRAAPSTAKRSTEADFSQLQTPPPVNDDPLRPFPQLLDPEPMPAPPITVPVEPTPPVQEPVVTPAALPPPVEPTVEAPPPVLTQAAPTPAPPTPEPIITTEPTEAAPPTQSWIEVATPVQVSIPTDPAPDNKAPEEPAAVIHAPVDTPPAQPVARVEPPAQSQADTLDIARASAAARQAALERAGFRCRIEVLANGNVAVKLLDPAITSLTPLVGLRIERLDASGCAALSGDLAALTGMPISDLRLNGCRNLTSLRGLRGAPLVRLDLDQCSGLTGDLTVIQGAKLTHLNLSGCRSLTSLQGLHGMPIQELNVSGCAALTSWSGLEGCPLRILVARDCKRVGGDCRPLAQSALTSLDLRGCSRLASLDGLPVTALAHIDLNGCDSLTNVTALRGAPLTRLDLSGCSALLSLDGLQGMPLTELRLYGCRALRGDFSAVRAAPLTLVDASYCSQMTSLNGLQDSPLKKLILTRNSGITDYATLAGIKGLDIVR